MSSPFLYIKSLREKLPSLYQSFSIEQLNSIPSGFKNNLAWQLGHIVNTPLILCYHRTAVAPQIEIPFLDAYKNGSKPEAFIDQATIQYFLEQLVPSLEVIEQDYKQGLFHQVAAATTHTFGVPMQCIEDYFDCINMHEALHYGQLSQMKKLI